MNILWLVLKGAVNWLSSSFVQIAYLLLFVITEPREKIRNQNDSIYFEPLIIFFAFWKTNH